MKKIIFIILPMIIFSCSGISDNSEKISRVKGYVQTTYMLDTIADKYMYTELQSIAEVSLDKKGKIAAVSQSNYTFDNPEGKDASSEELYYPDLFWQATEFETTYKKYAEQALLDTLIHDGEYSFQYNRKSQLSSFTMGFWYQIDFLYDQHGQWTKATEHFLEERSGHISYKITERKIQYEDEAIQSNAMNYLEVYGEDIFKKEKKSIIDYYYLLQKSGIFLPDNAGGTFDVSNGFFEYEDEGTGAGVYTGQLALFRTGNGKDIIALNGFSLEAISFTMISGSQPTFYKFENNVFAELHDIFPEVNMQLFCDNDYSGSLDGLTSYFTLPQKGLAIQYKTNDLAFVCNKVNDDNSSSDYLKEICEIYSNVRRTSIDIVFDKASGTFKLKI